MVEAAYRKYPNPHNTSVSSLDTIGRRTLRGLLFSHRIFATLWNLPSIVTNVLTWSVVARAGLDYDGTLYVSTDSRQ